MLFNVLADATEDNSKLAARAVGVAHRAHNNLLSASGVDSILPNAVKDFTDGAFRTNQNLILGVGHKSAEVLRKIEYVKTILELSHQLKYVNGCSHGLGHQQGGSSAHSHQQHGLEQNHKVKLNISTSIVICWTFLSD
jgi:hypothetical protein